MKVRHASVVLVLLLVAGCRKTVPYVRLDLSGTIAPASLRVTLALGTKTDVVAIDRGEPISLPAAVSLELPGNARGDLAVGVDVLDTSSEVIGHGDGKLQITDNGSFDLPIALGAAARDGGVDAAAPDLAPPAGIKLRATSSVPRTTSATISVSRPAQIVAGDFMWMAIIYGDALATLTTSPVAAGWTLHTSIPSGSCGGWTTAYFYKVATAMEPSSYVVTYSHSDYISAALMAYSGVDPSAPLGAQASSLINGLPYSTDLTTTVDGSLLLATFIINSENADPWVPAAGTTKVVGLADIAVFSGLQTTAGPTGSLSFGGPAGCGTYDFVSLNPR